MEQPPPPGAWWTADQAMAWLAFGQAIAWDEARKAAGIPDDEAALSLYRAVQRRISDAIAAGELPAWGQATAEIGAPPLCDTLVRVPREDFAGSSGLTVQSNGWTYPPELGRRYEGRWWQGLRFEAAAMRAAFAPPGPVPPKPAKTAESIPAPTATRLTYSPEGLAAWFRLRAATWPADKPPPKESQCIAAAKSHFADVPGRDVIRAIRRAKTPPSWRKRGPKPRR